jgi:hypothetical protein
MNATQTKGTEMLATIKMNDKGSKLSVVVTVPETSKHTLRNGKRSQRFTWPKGRCLEGSTPEQHALNRALSFAGFAYFRPMLNTDEVEIIK